MTFPTIPTVAGNSILQSSQATATTTHTFPSLTTLAPAAGDLLLAIIVTYQGGSTNAEFSSWGGGFAEFIDQSANSTTVQSIGAAYKFATGSETGTFTVTTVASTRSVMFLMQIPGAHTSTVPEATVKANGTTAGADPVALNPAGWDAEETLWIAVGVNGETSLAGSFTGITAAPTNYTNYLDSGIIGGDVIGALEGAVAFRQLNAASEDAGPFTLDVGAAGNSALLIAVRPAPAVAPPSIVITKTPQLIITEKQLPPQSRSIRVIGSSTGVTPTLTHRVVGVNGKIKTQTVNATSVRLKIGTDVGVTTGVQYTSAQTPDGNGNTTHDTSGLGLTAGGTYYYRVAMTSGAETLDANATVGRFKVAPTGQTNFAFNFSSCLQNASDSASMNAIATRADDLFFMRGDLWYADGSGTGVANFRSNMATAVQRPNHQKVFATTPVAYAPSDHDGGMNNNATGGTDATAFANFNTVYREHFPTPTLPSGGVYYSFMWGRVLFVNLDCRSFASNPTDTDNSSKTMLGATQKQWVKDEITNTTAKVIVLLGDTSWTGSAVAGSDAWEGYTTERAELATHFTNSKKNIVYVHGDQHAVSADNGTNAVGGIPSFCGAPLNNTASQKGGPWSSGRYPASGTAVVDQYARIVVTDSGSSISLAYTGYSSDNTVRITQTTTFAEGTTTGVFGFTSAVSGVPVKTGTVSTNLGFTSAVTGVPVKTGTINTNFGFTSTVTGVPVKVGTISSDLGFSATTTGTRAVTGAVSSAFALTSTVTGTKAVTGAVATALGFSGAIAGVPVKVGTINSNLGFSSAATGSVVGAVSGTISTDFGFTGSTTGTRIVPGTISTGFGFIGSTTGTKIVSGVVDTNFGFTGSTTGTRVVPGTISTGFGFTGSTTGTRVVSGTTTTNFGFTSDVTGTPIVAGQVTGTISTNFGFTSAVTGIKVVPGTISSDLGFTSLITGTKIVSGAISTNFGFSAPVIGISTGVISTNFGFTSAVTGAPVRVGTVSTDFGFTSAVSGVPVKVGTISSNLGFVTAVNGTIFTAGAVTGTISTVLQLNASGVVGVCIRPGLISTNFGLITSVLGSSGDRNPGDDFAVVDGVEVPVQFRAVVDGALV